MIEGAAGYSSITLAASLLLATAMAAPAAAQTHSELDAFWAEVSRTVAEGDYEGYAATYHPDAVLVSGPGRRSYPIAQALARWKQGFDDTRAEALLVKQNGEWKMVMEYQKQAVTGAEWEAAR